MILRRVFTLRRGQESLFSYFLSFTLYLISITATLTLTNYFSLPKASFSYSQTKKLQTMNETCSANFAGVKFESLWDKINTFFLAAKFNGLYSVSNLPRKQVVFLSFLSVCFVDRPTNERDFSQITLRKLQKTSAGPYRRTTFLLF